MTTSARSTSSRSTSSRRTSVNSRSKGPAKTSRSRSRSAARTGNTVPAADDGGASADRAYAHRAAHVPEHRRGDRASLLGAVGQDVLERRLVRAQRLVALMDRAQALDDRLRDRDLEVAVARVGVRPL